MINITKLEADYILYTLQETLEFIKEVEPLVDFSEGVLDSVEASDEILRACIFNYEMGLLKALEIEEPPALDGTACID